MNAADALRVSCGKITDADGASQSEFGQGIVRGPTTRALPLGSRSGPRQRPHAGAADGRDGSPRPETSSLRAPHRRRRVRRGREASACRTRAPRQARVLLRSGRGGPPHRSTPAPDPPARKHHGPGRCSGQGLCTSAGTLPIPPNPTRTRRMSRCRPSGLPWEGRDTLPSLAGSRGAPWRCPGGRCVRSPTRRRDAPPGGP